ncbi:MAG: transglutaminaseTgpA domain-containing protein [Desertimonas sp.]
MSIDGDLPEEPPRHGSVLLETTATLALIAYSLATAAALIRVYDDWGFFGDAVAVVLVGHGLPFLIRRIRVPALLSVVVPFPVLAMLVVRLVHPDTVRAGLVPTGASWDAVAADLRFIGDEFAGAVAPVPYGGGWALLGMAALAAVVWLADAFAFSARGRGEALVPGAVLFVFVAALGTSRSAIPLTLALIATGVAVVAALRANFAPPARTTLGPTRHPLVTVVPAAVLVGVVVVLSAWTVGPRLPGADDEPWVDTRGNGGGGVTLVTSPLVDIRSRLVDQSDAEMMVVTATAEANWRVSTLAQFDGTTWGLPQRSLGSAGGELNEPRPASTRNEQIVRIVNLGGRLVPAAADPVRVEGEGLRFNDDSSTLVRTDRELAAGDVYAVDSAMPSFEVAALQAASASDPSDDIYLALPDDFPDTVRALAAEVTAGAATPYDQARTLQDWFRSQFEYTLEVPAGHSISAIEAFLERRSGYCEQFAGTMAAMARSLGLPARVAVGFTPGTRDETGAFHVTGRQAHAWPEIWFDGYGWVAFEPTPGRGAPGMEEVTGAAPAQDAPPPPTEQTPPPATAPAQDGAPTTTAAANQAPANDGATPAPPPDQAARTDGAGGLPWRWLLLAVVLIGGGIATPAVIRRLRRQRRAADPAQHITELWGRARHLAEASTGDRLDPTHTPLEQASDLAPRLPAAAQPLRSLAEAATTAAYGPPGALAGTGWDRIEVGDGPDQWCHEIEEIATDAMSTSVRVREYFTNWD